MSKSAAETINGKAYEYACVLALVDLVSPVRAIKVEESSSVDIARGRFEDDIDAVEQNQMIKSAKVGIEAIIEMEPRIVEDSQDELTVSLQPDNAAKKGDIRDVLIIRHKLEWEIGISVKHNHAALKHSRLSQTIDFGKEWVGVPCSENYFEEIRPIFERLNGLKEAGTKWRDLPDKMTGVYVPLLAAFMKEFKSLESSNKEITRELVRYLLGSNGRDYYKLIHRKDNTTTVMPFNIYGTLNQASDESAPGIEIPSFNPPTRIIELSFKEKSLTTVILTMNNGWAISFRIHNATTIVEPSLKFDIQLQGKPADMFYLEKKW